VSTRKVKASHWRSTDLQAGAKLAIQATVQVTHIVEGVHQSVLGTLGFKGRTHPAEPHQPQGPRAAAGLTGLIYQSIRTITAWVGGTVDLGLNLAEPLLNNKTRSKPGNKAQGTSFEVPSTSAREAVLAALNGVIGDRLTINNNPLATKMNLRFAGEKIELSTAAKIEMSTDAKIQLRTGAGPPRLGSKILLVIHGLCMNDLQWSAKTKTTSKNHAEALAKEFGYTPVYLRYNTGLSIAENGRQLSEQLDALMVLAPKLGEISVLCHSMGGLVIRSALHQASIGKSQPNQLAWQARIKRVVFLGTPHHGAPLERAGGWIDLILASTPFSAPFKRLTQLRSAGITDLRYGRISSEPSPIPLPTKISFFVIAATTAAKRSLLAERLLGDGLVPLNSALGRHKTLAKTLAFADENQAILYRMNHMQLLSRPEVAEQLRVWFRQDG
jgi:hypothetical protein